MTGSTQHATTADNVASLGWIAECLNVLARCGHERLTVQQALFFAATAYHRKLGEVVTVPDLRAKHPLGRSIEKSKFQLSEPSIAFPEALGWLQQETDPDDGRRRYAPAQRQATAQAATAVGQRRNRRSLWERFSDNVSDTWNTSFVAESYRAGRLEGAQNAAGLVSVQELNKRDGLLGNPIRSYGRAVGALGQAFQPEATMADASGDVTGEAAQARTHVGLPQGARRGLA